MTKNDDDTDWKEAYFKQQVEIAKVLGCPAHPNDIHAAIRDVKRRASLMDQEFSTRLAKIKDTLRAALLSIDVPRDRVDLVEDDLEQIARDITGEL